MTGLVCGRALSVALQDSHVVPGRSGGGRAVMSRRADARQPISSCADRHVLIRVGVASPRNSTEPAELLDKAHSGVQELAALRYDATFQHSPQPVGRRRGKQRGMTTQRLGGSLAAGSLNVTSEGMGEQPARTGNKSDRYFLSRRAQGSHCVPGGMHSGPRFERSIDCVDRPPHGIGFDAKAASYGWKFTRRW